jgi:septum formation protein
MDRIVLASASARRKQLLEWAEIPFEVLVSEVAEDFPDGLAPEEVALYLAFKKARAVREQVGNQTLILAADTIVVLDNRIIGKPRDRSEAMEILTLLSGRDHFVITGVALVKGIRECHFADRTEVSFHALNSAQIQFYVDRYKPYDKAGAYAIQEWIGVVGIKSIRGDFYNVMGLPVSRVVQEINSWPPEEEKI